MSIDSSIEAVVASNNTLAEANLTLAKALTYYADTVNKFGLKIEKGNEGRVPVTDEAEEEEAPVAEKKPRGRPAKAKPEPTPDPETEEEDDGFGDDDDEVEEEKPLTAEVIKNELKAVRDAAGKDKALAIIQKLGYKAIPEIKEKDYKAVHDACQKILK